MNYVVVVFALFKHCHGSEDLRCPVLHQIEQKNLSESPSLVRVSFISALVPSSTAPKVHIYSVTLLITMFVPF